MCELSKTEKLILFLRAQIGKGYRLGAEVVLTPETFGNHRAYANVTEWDCSELCQTAEWVAGIERIGNTHVSHFDGAGNQYLACPKKIGMEVARTLPGALLFIQSASSYPNKPANIGHVAIVIAPDTIIEARGRAYGVTIGKIRPSFNRACKVQELYA